jgi:AhpD family alkylhydroperoxidase
VKALVDWRQLTHGREHTPFAVRRTARPVHGRRAMRILSNAILVLLIVTCGIALYAATPADETFKQIKQQYGFVPGFMKGLPDEGVPAAWGEMQALEMSTDTALPGKNKELIALGVSAQIPCRYCIYADTQFARAAGASDKELKEAIAQAAITRHWSTVLNGMQIDPAAFDRELQSIMTYLKSSGAKPAPAQSAPVTDAQSAYKDMQSTLGTVPSFMKAFPEKAIAPAWLEFKNIELNPATTLDGKTKELIGLAVAAQIPCKYCVSFHTAAAKLNGATEDEVKEAVAMAALTRYFSTIVNGTLQDEAQFRREVDQAVKASKKAEKAPAAAQR